MKRVSIQKCCLLGGVCILSMFVGFHALAEVHTMQKEQSVMQSGRMAVVDPDTGQLVSGEKAANVMERESLKVDTQKFMSSVRAVMAFDQDVSALVENKLATGAVKVDLKGHFRSPVLATIHPDRTITMTHELTRTKDGHHHVTNY